MPKQAPRDIFDGDLANWDYGQNRGADCPDSNLVVKLVTRNEQLANRVISGTETLTEASKVLDPEAVYLVKDRPQHDTAPTSVR